MKKKLIGGFAVITCGVMLLTGCGEATSASAAARMSDKTANRADSVLSKLETFEDSHYNFPAAFGGDFFIKENSDTQKFRQENPTFATRNFGKERTAQVNATPTNPEEVASKKPKRPKLSKRTKKEQSTAHDARYSPKYFQRESLNLQNPARVSYMNSLDDLYSLCADVSAANAHKNKLVSEIRSSAATMRGLAQELRGAKHIRDNWAEFNKAQKEADKGLTELYRDRKNLQKSLKVLSNNTHIEPEGMSTRYNVVLNKLDSRVQKLEATKAGLCNMNNAMRMALGKPTVDHKVNSNINHQANKTQPALKQTTKPERAKTKNENNHSRKDLVKLPPEHNTNFQKASDHFAHTGKTHFAHNHQHEHPHTHPEHESHSYKPTPTPRYVVEKRTPPVKHQHDSQPHNPEAENPHNTDHSYQQATTIPYVFSQQEQSQLNQNVAEVSQQNTATVVHVETTTHHNNQSDVTNNQHKPRVAYSPHNYNKTHQQIAS